jgi:hypothetical protein
MHILVICWLCSFTLKCESTKLQKDVEERERKVKTRSAAGCCSTIRVLPAVISHLAVQVQRDTYHTSDSTARH